MAKKAPNNRLSHALLLVFYVFALLACSSYQWTDWPSGRLAVHPWPVANLCGPVGAWLAYQALSFLGYAVFVMLIFAGALSVLRLLNREVSDLPLRGIGLGFLVLSISAISYLLVPSLNFPAGNPLPFTAGGVIGSILGSFFLSQLSGWGSGLVLTAGVLVGLLLAADSSVVFLLQLLWSKLSILLGKLPGLRVLLRRPLALSSALPRINPHRAAMAVPAGGGTAIALEEDEDEEDLEDDEDEEEWEEDEEEDEESADELQVKVHGLKDRPAGKAEPGLRVAAKAIAKPKALVNYQLPPLDLLEQPEN